MGKKDFHNLSPDYRLKYLKEEAHLITGARGHSLSYFGSVVQGRNAVAVCKNCNMAVCIDISPVGGNKDMEGRALTRNCPGKSS